MSTINAIRGLRRHRTQRTGPFQRFLGAPLVWLFVAFNVAVLAWLLLSSTKTTRDLIATPWSLPHAIQWDNFARAWSAGNFGPAALNSAVLVAGTAAATIAVAAPAGYALSRLGARSAEGMTSLFAIGLGIPAQAIFLPLYAVMNSLGLVDSLWGLGLLYTATSMPFAVFFLTGFFRSLPAELEEAAALDGATPWYTFWRIMLPLARSGLVTLLLLNVIGHWGETFFALVFIQSQSLQTLPLAMLGFLQQMQYSGADWGGMFAGIAIVVLPIVVLYIWLGRRIIEGMTLGSGK
ncbi:carbohydrate ABC transporter permease [Streptomyces beijiangensis]|uniref:Carbohydrate ABC transporter permease n=1 Tax=Streptomyces beijiangensis TaxID=163361 RepID=A0A939F0Q0_9ACTN|nr:carbohydrate ABC transporter permease [Streptomyces beijiangensis]MBO0510366.1 carbohydrate ABC transporter permease [Streptomyces beijiangensis]